MSDTQFKSIMVTFLFDMSIFLVELLIFFCIRNKRDKGNMLLNQKDWQVKGGNLEIHNEYLKEF